MPTKSKASPTDPLCFRFEVFISNNEDKLDIFIKHPSHDPRPLEMGSGAEKTIAAMAIRLSLLSVSSLPKGSIFILDEPATALDAENMEGFIRILDMIKSYYQTVLLISHVDHLKDIADMTIEIDTDAWPIQTGGDLFDMRRLAGAVEPLDQQTPVVGKGYKDRERGVVIKAVCIVEIRHMLGFLREGRNLHIDIKVESLTSRHRCIRQVYFTYIGD